MRYTAAGWVASLPKELERKIVLGVEFIPAEEVDLEVWKPTFPISKYAPDDLLFVGFTGSIPMTQLSKLHLARTEIEVDDQAELNIGNVASEIVFPSIRRAALVVEVASRTGHIYIASVIKIGNEGDMREYWLGESNGRPQGWPTEDILELMEDIFKNCRDKLFQRKIENALIFWAESKEEPRDALRIAKLWTALDALLKKKGEKDIKIQTRTIALAKTKRIESIELSSMHDQQLTSFLKKVYCIRNAVYHEAEDLTIDLGMTLDLSSLTQASILKMAEFAHSAQTWEQTIKYLDQFSFKSH